MSIRKYKITGERLLDSPIEKNNCYYWEFSIYDGKGTWVSYKSDTPFFAEIDGKKVELQLPPARLYMKPTYEKTYATMQKESDSSTPLISSELYKIVASIFDDEIPQKITIKEWYIAPNKSYFINRKKESLYLPSVKDEEPGERFAIAYEISDKQYSTEEKSNYRTPESSWTY